MIQVAQDQRLKKLRLYKADVHYVGTTGNITKLAFSEF